MTEQVASAIYGRQNHRSVQLSLDDCSIASLHGIDSIDENRSDLLLCSWAALILAREWILSVEADRIRLNRDKTILRRLSRAAATQRTVGTIEALLL